MAANAVLLSIKVQTQVDRGSTPGDGWKFVQWLEVENCGVQPLFAHHQKPSSVAFHLKYPMKLFTSSVASSSSSSSCHSFPSTITTLYPLPAPLILRTPCVILRHHLPLSPPSVSARNTLPPTLSASPTHNHLYPDPSPHFAQFETRKFKVELLNKLSHESDEFGNDLHAVVDVCAQVNAPFFAWQKVFSFS
ncbi:hypothetical protein PIB30_049087 [Stylosanthes scabra]|uniref:Uncharacterized protein n=1 Tax=Stylosanthes scabra TaxID=79078 RepID=A0ABU6RH90_9FABA|nr:hypothetical protein [Stylosanthes scabra]